MRKETLKFNHIAIALCSKCNHIQLYGMTEVFVARNMFDSLCECYECKEHCKVCFLSKYQKPPGFARKCGNCNYKFTCATIDIKHCEPILYTVNTFKVEWKDGSVVPMEEQWPFKPHVVGSSPTAPTIIGLKIMN